MRLRTFAFGTVAAAGLLAVPQHASAQFDRRTLETVAALILAEKLNLDPAVVLAATGRLGGSVYDLAPAFVLHEQVPARSVDSIWELRRSGMGWGEIAKRIGMHPGTFNKLRNSGQLDPNGLWRQSFTEELRLDRSTVDRLRAMGLSWSDITSASIIARESGRSIWDVVARWQSTRDWNAVARTFGVSGSTVNTRVQQWRTTRAVPSRWRTPIVTSRPQRVIQTDRRRGGSSVRRQKVDDRGGRNQSIRSGKSGKGDKGGSQHGRGRGHGQGHSGQGGGKGRGRGGKGKG